MPRYLNDKPCELILDDRISGTKITIYHILPTTEDRVAYTNAFVVRRGNKIKSELGDARLKYGLKIITGFKEGDFALDEKKPLSADPASPNYNPAWKMLLKQHAADIVEMVAVHVYEAPVSRAMPELPADEAEPAEPEGADKKEGSEAAPLA